LRFPWQLQAKLSAGASGLILLDVRTPLEYNWFHLPGAQNLPHVLADGGKMPPVSPYQEIVVICVTGHRSPLAAYALKKRATPGSTILPGEWQGGSCMSRSPGC